MIHHHFKQKKPKKKQASAVYWFKSDWRGIYNMTTLIAYLMQASIYICPQQTAIMVG